MGGRGGVRASAWRLGRWECEAEALEEGAALDWGRRWAVMGGVEDGRDGRRHASSRGGWVGGVRLGRWRKEGSDGALRMGRGEAASCVVAWRLGRNDVRIGTPLGQVMGALRMGVTGGVMRRRVEARSVGCRLGRWRKEVRAVKSSILFFREAALDWGAVRASDRGVEDGRGEGVMRMAWRLGGWGAG
ncbi:hypothetical protein H5410_064827 [Solanum commersonii]|uniref:Uncharacterized protein n=1 Tax=Solanum commersonii TaxID=4109 RepID=A0A9J5VYL3_SOLCO|nr:hypothetical protein H5410_064827 [Solanum commersonii]